jgi:hypothetical protein
MAVKMKMTQTDANSLLQELGVAVAHLDMLEKHGIQCWLQKDSLLFAKDGSMLSAVTMKTGVLSLIKKGVLKKHSLNHLTAVVEHAIHEACEKSSIVTAPAPKVEASVAAPATVSKAAAPAPELVMMMDAVPLADAKLLYQPVHGTSGGSVYYVVAISKDLKAAARIKNGKISFRIEGAVEKHKDEFAMLGMSMASEKHSSMHLEVGNLDMARRTLGSLLLGMPIEWETPYPKVDLIYGKGE